MMLGGFSIGSVHIPGGLMAAPMAGVTDRPFRSMCRRLGADAAVSEMLISDQRLWHSRKSTLRMNHQGEVAPIIVQIAGACPQMMASAAVESERQGADVVDINMGCPAKKVCNTYAGSALLSNESLVQEILEAVVAATAVPVTLKIRTGPAPDCRNAVRIARIAERAGIAALAIHGRTREEKYTGQAEYRTIADVRQVIDMPLIANGDINDGPRAASVLAQTQADGLMIGRGAQGNPWIFSQIRHYLDNGVEQTLPSACEVRREMTRHIRQLHRFYGESSGVRVARKHIGWYLAQLPDGLAYRRQLMKITDADDQIAALESLPVADGTQVTDPARHRSHKRSGQRQAMP